jgi:Ca2+-binding RTX toxin-like protein
MGAAYSGPVAGLQCEYITTTTASLNITAAVPNVFIHTGSGNDAIAVSGGTNVLDGSTGSNFLVGATGDDTFFVDDREPTSDIWSTVVNFQSGDAATVWGVTPGDFSLSWVDGQGAAGYTGLTLHASAAGVPTASLTLAGFASGDLTNGRLTVSFGTTAATDGVPGSSYMNIHAN